MNDLFDPEDSGKNPVWLIAQADDGLGFELTRAALERGDFVVATTDAAPTPLSAALKTYPHALVALQSDENDADQAQAVMDTALRCFGHVDIVVAEAGKPLADAGLSHLRDRGTGHVVAATPLTGSMTASLKALGIGVTLIDANRDTRTEALRLIKALNQTIAQNLPKDAA